MPVGPHGTRSFWQDWTNIGLGAWLFVSPWVLGYEPVRAAAWNSWIFGILIVAVSLSAVILYAPWEEWANVLFAVWLLVSPWLMGFASAETSAALWNHVGVGLLVGGFALWDALEHAAEDRVAI